MKKDKLEFPTFVRLTKNERELLKSFAEKEDTSMSNIMRDFIRTGLSLPSKFDTIIELLNEKNHD